MGPTISPAFVNAKGAAQLLYMSRTTFWRMTKEADFPAPIRVHADANAIYKVADLIAWMDSKQEVAHVTSH